MESDATEDRDKIHPRAKGWMDIDVKALRKAMPLVKMAVLTKRNAVGGLACVRLHEGSIMANNFDTSVNLVIGEGTIDCAISFTELKRAAATMPRKGTVHVVASDEGTSVAFGDCVLYPVSVGLLAAMPDTSNAEYITELSPQQMTKAMQIALAASDDLTWPALCGVQLQRRDHKTFSLAATDRFRIHWVELPGEVGGLSARDEWFLNADVLTAVGDLAKGTNVRLMTFGAYQTVYRFANGEVTHRQADAQFPKWRGLINPDNDHVTVNRLELKAAAKKVQAVMRASDIRLDTLMLQFRDDSVDATAYDWSEMRQLLSVAMSSPTHTSKKMAGYQVGISSKYLLDFLDCIDGDTVTIGYVGPKLVHTFVGESQSGAISALIMPIKPPTTEAARSYS